MSEKDKRSNSVSGNTEDDPDNVSVSGLPEGYPPLAPINALAKDHDFALLQDCTVERMREIAKDYPGVSGRQRKVELYQALYDAMVVTQECPTCCLDDGCDPLTHKFPPLKQPPQGWVQGANGLFGPPAGLPSVTPSRPQPTSSTSQSTTAQSGMLDPQAPLDLVNTNFRTVNPATDLLRNSGSADLPISDTSSPYVPGVQQQQQTPPNLAEIVTTGAASASWDQGADSLAARIHPVEDNFEKELEDALAAEVAQARERRRLEVEQAERERQQAADASKRRQEYETRRRASVKAALEAEERAHKLRMEQIRAETARVSVAPTHSHSFLPPPPASSVPSSAGFLPAGPAPPPVSDPHRTRAVSWSDNLCSATTPPPPSLSGNPHQHCNSTAQILPGVDPASLDAIIDQRLRALGHGAPHTHYSNPQLCADKGKILTHKVTNSHMASRLGVFAQPVFEVPGDVTEVDMAKMQKVMTAGHDKVGAGLVLRHMRWPHRLLQTNVPGFDVVEHKDLTFHQFINGCISKFLSEVPNDRLDLELANKFSFLQFLVNMSFRYKHEDVLETYRQVHHAWQMRDFEFTDDWATIDERLKNIRSHLTISPQEHTFTKVKYAASGGKPGGPPNKPHGDHSGSGPGAHVKGVPKSYMKKQNVCIKFNEGECPEKQSHKNKYNENVTLRHVCGGCLKASGSQHVHPCKTCDKGPFETLFRNG